MDGAIALLAEGFGQLLHPATFLHCFAGVLIGTLVGVLPGLGPVATMSMLFPLTMGGDALHSIVMLAGIYYGAMYGGSTTSILVNMPGEAASVVTCLDGYEMAKQGRAGRALGIAAFGSFIGGTLSVAGLMLLAIPLSRVALGFGPAEYFGFTVLGLSVCVFVGGRSLLKGCAMAALGLLLGCIGTDLVSGAVRFAYGAPVLQDGLNVASMVMGLFGISEILMNVAKPTTTSVIAAQVRGLLPTRDDWRQSLPSIGRGSVVGFLLGLGPGGGSILSSFVSYSIEKRVARDPSRFGKGAIEGVAGPETANNASVASGFIPLFTLGVPSNVVMALLLANLMVHKVAPGPSFIGQNPQLFWAIVASMYVGNVLLLILNLPLIGLWVRFLRIRYGVLFPIIVLFCVVGAYSINSSYVDVLIMAIFGLLGVWFRRFDYPLVPLVFAFVLGPTLELSLNQLLIVGGDDYLFLFTRPVAATAFVLAVLLAISGLVASGKRFRQGVLETGGEA